MGRLAILMIIHNAIVYRQIIIFIYGKFIFLSQKTNIFLATKMTFINF